MALCHSGILQSLKFRHILGQSEKTKERDISQKTRKGGEGMTRGFFVFEENYSVKKAVELSGSAYLQDGYGGEIVEADKNGKEESYFRSLCQQMDSEQKKELLKIWSGWDRKTKTSVLNNRYSDMGT